MPTSKSHAAIRRALRSLRPGAKAQPNSGAKKAGLQTDNRNFPKALSDTGFVRTRSGKLVAGPGAAGGSAPVQAPKKAPSQSRVAAIFATLGAIAAGVLLVRAAAGAQDLPIKKPAIMTDFGYVVKERRGPGIEPR